MILRGTVGGGQAGMRLDDGARALFPQLSKGRIRKIIDWGGCTVSGGMVRVASRQLRGGEEIVLGVMEPERYQELLLAGEDILCEDGDFLAVNKRAGVNSQRTPYQLKGTLEHAVSQYLKGRGIGGEVMIVHRLDRGTSGVVFFPKQRRAAAHISRLLKEGEVEKLYWALVAGRPEKERWTVDLPIAKVGSARYGVATPGKEARTEFRVVARGEGTALVEARPLTGRTHQIRVHLAHSGHPVAGDRTYGGLTAPRMMLHCRSMAFRAEDGRRVEAVAPVDGPFLDVCGGYGINPAMGSRLDNLISLDLSRKLPIFKQSNPDPPSPNGDNG